MSKGFMIAYAICVVITIAICFWLTKVVIESDLPFWIKWIILR